MQVPPGTASAMPLSHYALDKFVSQRLSKLTSCVPQSLGAEFPDRSLWLSQFILNRIFQNHITEDRAGSRSCWSVAPKRLSMNGNSHARPRSRMFNVRANTSKRFVISKAPWQHSARVLNSDDLRRNQAVHQGRRQRIRASLLVVQQGPALRSLRPCGAPAGRSARRLA